MGVVHSPPTPRFDGDDRVHVGDFMPSHEGISCQTIAEVILDAPAADITLSNIPQNYRDLMLTGNLRNDSVTTSYKTAKMQFNGDTSANYRVEIETDIGISVTHSADGGNDAGMCGGFNLWVLDYGQTVWHKHAVSTFTVESIEFFASSVLGGMWLSTNTITDIRIFPTAGNFVAGSRVTVFGLV